ncbi:MAG: hypothetical protein NUW24_16735, partial [Anaerolineae bacterium]|nr:hypothetical protein [Anaerolineae bacterium]
QHPSLTSVKFSVGRRVTHELLGESLKVSVETTERIEVEIRPTRMAAVAVVVPVIVISAYHPQILQWFSQTFGPAIGRAPASP